MNNSNLSPEELVTTIDQLRTEFRSLQWSYQKLEDDYRILQIQVKRGKRLRRWWLVLIITAGLATGWHLRSEELLTYLEQQGLLVTDSATASSTPAVPKFIKVEQRSLPVTLPHLMGKIEPLKQVEIVSPVAGKVKAKHFEYNQMVKHGQILLVIDTTDEERNYRSTQAEFIEGKNQVEDLRHWSTSQEVRTAQRQLTEAQYDLATAKRKLEESRGLLQKGIVPSSEVEEGEETVRSKELAYQATQEQLEAILKKGSADNLKVAELKMEVALSKMEDIQTRIAQANVVSPMDGVVFLPPQSNSSSSEQTTLEIQEGSMVKQDQRLLMIANFEGFIVTAKVEEIHILKLAPGQTVTIKGEAFPQVTLEGVIKDISSQADPDQPGPTDQVISKFSVTIAVSKLTADQKKHLRLGMSTEMEVMLSKKDQSLVVPFEAVTIKDKEAWVTVLDKTTGKPKEVKVKLGQTLVDGALEIVEGIQVDDKLLPRPVEPDKEKKDDD